MKRGIWSRRHSRHAYVGRRETRRGEKTRERAREHENRESQTSETFELLQYSGYLFKLGLLAKSCIFGQL